MLRTRIIIFISIGLVFACVFYKLIDQKRVQNNIGDSSQAANQRQVIESRPSGELDRRSDWGAASRDDASYKPNISDQEDRLDVGVFLAQMSQESTDDLQVIAAEISDELLNHEYIEKANSGLLDERGLKHLDELLNREAAVKIVLLDRYLKDSARRLHASN